MEENDLLQPEPVKVPTNSEQILKGLNDEISKVAIPNGYIEIKLSTKGNVGAPEVFHLRNFDTADLMDLALAEQEELPLKVIDFLGALILEKDVSIKNFHEKEVIETLIILFRSFFSQFLKDLPYELNKEDWEWAHKKYGDDSSEEFKAFKRAIDNKEFTPKITIDIDQIEFNDLKDGIKKIVVAETPNFTAKFTYPKYGDVMLIKKHIDKVFADDDKKYAKLMDILKYRRDAEDKIRRGENVAYGNLPNITPFDMEKLKEYQIEKGKFTVNAVKALSLIEIDGKDISNMPLGDKIKLVSDDHRLDHSLISSVTEYFEKFADSIGINEKKVKYLNPIQQVYVEARFSFRVFDIIQAAQLQKSDTVTIRLE
jgi:hypothetical protein